MTPPQPHTPAARMAKDGGGRPPRLLLITQDGGKGVDALRPLLDHGAVDLLLRDKAMDGRGLFYLAERLRVQLNGGRLFVSERVDVALAVGAHGVHLPERSLPVAVVRRLLGRGMLLGRSCHDLAGAQAALAQGADYVTLSPLFATRSHPGKPPLGIQAFAYACQRIPGPVLALGGITVDNAPAAMAAGASGVALIRGLGEAPDPLAAFLRLQSVVETSHAP